MDLFDATRLETEEREKGQSLKMPRGCDEDRGGRQGARKDVDKDGTTFYTLRQFSSDVKDHMDSLTYVQLGTGNMDQVQFPRLSRRILMTRCSGVHNNYMAQIQHWTQKL